MNSNEKCDKSLESKTPLKCIQIAIVGAPNVGKSSLLNKFIGEKNSIVSPKPHTTRNAILGVVNIDETQLVFVDTPGYLRQGTSIWANHFIASAKSALEDADLILLLIDPTQPHSHGTKELLSGFGSSDKIIICVNKIDVKAKGKLYEIAADIMNYGYKDKIFLISTKSSKGIEDLQNEILNRAKENEWMFDSNEETKMAKELYAAECVREKAFHCLYDEIPFCMWTVPVTWSFKKDQNKAIWSDHANWKIEVDIVISKESHKKIVIGHHGECIKRIGIAARTELESLWGRGQLFLNVVLDKEWATDPEKVKAICTGNTYASFR